MGRRLFFLLGAVFAVSAGAFFWVEVPGFQGLAASRSQEVSYSLPLSPRASVAWETEVADFSRRLQQGFDYLAPDQALWYAEMILEASHRQHVPPDWIAGLIDVESHFRANVRSSSGAVGPAQVKPEHWTEECGGVDLYVPENNIQCGAQALMHYYEREDCDNFDCALTLYNIGPGNYRNSVELRAAGREYAAKVGRSRGRIPE